jgi:uncharacterized protein (TIGR02246 family)
MTFRLEVREDKAMFQKLIHPADFDELSREAFRVARRPERSILPWRTAMHWKSIVPFTLLALVVLGGGFTAAQDKTTKDPKRESDRLAIDQLTNDMIQAFDKRDAAAIAAHWTEEGEFIHNDGEPIRGRAEIQKGYAEFFKTLKGKPKLEIQSDAVRFPSADMAVAEVTLRLKNDGDIVASGRQAIVAVREGGQWKVAIIREWDRDVGLDVGLKELEWLIGTWRAVTKEREVTITYAWDEHKAFIRGTFTVKEGAKVIESGTELIGKDHTEGVIRSWVFQSDSGFGSGVWAREGKKWSVDVHGVRADGRKLTGTIIYIQVDPNTVTWQAVNQAHDGVPLSDTPPIKVTKQKSAK